MEILQVITNMETLRAVLDSINAVSHTVAKIQEQRPETLNIVIAIIGSSVATTLLQNVFSWKSNKVSLRKNEAQLKKEEIEIDTQLQEYYKDKYQEVMEELEKLKKEINVVKNKLTSQNKLRRENAELRKQIAAACTKEVCPNKLIKPTKNKTTK